LTPSKKSCDVVEPVEIGTSIERCTRYWSGLLPFTDGIGWRRVHLHRKTQNF